MGCRVTIVLPALDEAQAIAATVAGLLGQVDEVLVVDNGSTDGTGEIAAAAGARVIVERRRGFGAACHAGATHARGDLLCFMDADGTFAAPDAARVIDEVRSGRLDLCLGTRTRRRDAAISPAMRIANRALGASVRLAGGPVLSDIGPLRAIRRDALMALELRDRAFAWPLEMVVRASRRGLRIDELPVAYLPRAGGTSKVSGSLRGSARAAWQMSRLLARETVPWTRTS